jgi:excisionase family DNA binding protein
MIMQPMRNGQARTVEPMTYRVTEAAAALGVSRSTAYELISSGTIPSVRVGRCVRVPVDALRAWLNRQLESREAAAR